MARSINDDVAQSSVFYYPNDLVTVGWNAALVYDTPAAAKLQFRFWSTPTRSCWNFAIMTNGSRASWTEFTHRLKYRAGIWRRWKMRTEALRLNSITVEVTELAERSETAIKFVSDMYSARLYRLAAAKVGVPEYKNLVNEKLHTAEALYRFLIDEFHQSRGFVLEVMVVIILVIELVYLFRGKY